MEPFDTDTFIAVIRAEPAIWDYKSEAYNKRIQTWKKICGIFHENFQGLSSKEQRDIAANLQKKWKRLRDGYNRELKRLKKVENGEGASKKKKYIYFEQLSFLEPLAQQNRTTSTLDDKNDGDGSLPHVVDGIKDEEVLPPLKNNGPKKNKANKEDESIENISKKQTVDASNISQDEDTLFCLSLVTDFREIVDDLKSDAKCEVLAVLNKYKSLSFPSSSTLKQLQPRSSSHFPITVSTPLLSPSFSIVSSHASVNDYSAGIQEETKDSVSIDLF